MFDKHGKKKTDEQGFVLVGALLILLLLVLIGVSASTSTFLELQIASSHKARALGFYSAEAGVSYVRASPELYGDTNISEDYGLRFPYDPGVTPALSDTPENLADQQVIGANADQAFQGTVIYKGSGALPRGSGYDESLGLSAHFYEIQSTGRGPNDAEVTVMMRAYRIGY